MKNKFSQAAASFEGFEDQASVGKKLAATGFTPVAVPKPGATVDVFALCAAREALAYTSGMADSVLAVIGLGSFAVGKVGGKELCQQYLEPVLAGDAVCGFALTEPEAGSDVANMQLFAKRDGDHYVLDGKKCFTSNATIADWLTVFAQSDAGPIALIIETSDPGVTIVDDTPMSAPHPIGSVLFSSAKIPATRLLGQEGDGIKLAFATLDTFRVSVAAAACGMAQRALDEAISHVKERQQFGKRLAAFQMTQARIADCATELAASRGLVDAACQAVTDGSGDAKMKVAMAKLYATESAGRTVDAAVQLFGGLGVVRGQKVEALTREIRPLRIYEGTSEIQKLIIARELLR